MALEDIQKLKEKVAKDPNSRLFVPLADEYRKTGMLDEAISVLLNGLSRQPGYMSARVSLGKVYLEKKMIAEAKEEFEKVISAIPDNLFAHKKLAEIYRDSGDKDRAKGEYRIVLKLNPVDEDAMSNLETLQSKHVIKESAVAPEPGPEELPVQEPAAPPEAVVEATEAEEEIEILPAEEISESVPEDEFEKFKKSITGREEEAGEIVAEEVIPEDIEEIVIEDVIPDEVEEAEEIVAEEIIAEEDIEEAEKEALTYIDMFKETETAQPAPSFETLFKEEKPGAEPLEKEEKPSNLKAAELFISGGNYSKAMKVYRGLLSANPQDRYILQRVEDLKWLLKMLGKEKDVLIEKLEAFGEGLEKRKNEFLRNP